MPDIDILNIIKINIHTIGTKQTSGGNICCVNMYAVQRDDLKQETVRAEKCYTNTDNISKSNNKTKPLGKSKLSITVEYYLSELSYDSDKKRSAETTQQLRKDFEDEFNGNGCSDGTFSLQLKLDSKPYHVPLRCMAYALQKPFEEELERLQKQDIIVPLGVDKTSEWCNSFDLVPKANGKVRLCLDPAQLNQALIRPRHRGPTLNNILPNLKNAKYLSFVEASSGHHNLKLDEKSPYFTKFVCQFGRYRYKQLPFGAVPAGDMFQRRID